MKLCYSFLLNAAYFSVGCLNFATPCDCKLHLTLSSINENHVQGGRRQAKAEGGEEVSGHCQEQLAQTLIFRHKDWKGGDLATRVSKLITWNQNFYILLKSVLYLTRWLRRLWLEESMSGVSADDGPKKGLVRSRYQLQGAKPYKYIKYPNCIWGSLNFEGEATRNSVVGSMSLFRRTQ